LSAAAGEEGKKYSERSLFLARARQIMPKKTPGRVTARSKTFLYADDNDAFSSQFRSLCMQHAGTLGFIGVAADFAAACHLASVDAAFKNQE